MAEYTPGAFIDPACPINWAHPLTQTLAAAWAVVPNTGWRGGFTFRDLVRGGRNPHDATLVNMIDTSPATSGWRIGTRPGGYGYLLFDGSNDYLQTASAVPAASAPPVTMAAWVNVASLSAARTIFGGVDGCLQFRIETTGALRFIKQNITNIGTGTVGVVTTNVWLRVVGTYDASGNWVFYVNGVPAGSGTSLQTLTAGALNIGRHGGSSPTEFMSGGMDDLLILGKIWTAAEAEADYLESKSGNPNRWNWMETDEDIWAPSAGGILYTLTFAAVCTVSGTFVKQVGAVRSCVSAGTALLLKQIQRAFSGSSTAAASLNKRAGKTTAASSSGAASLLRTCGKAYSAACTGAATLGKSISRTLSAASSGAATMAKRVSRTVAASCTGAGAWIAAKVVLLGFIILNRFGFGDGGSTSSLGDGGSSSAKGDDGTFGGGTA